MKWMKSIEKKSKDKQMSLFFLIDGMSEMVELSCFLHKEMNDSFL